MEHELNGHRLARSSSTSLQVHSILVPLLLIDRPEGHLRSSLAPKLIQRWMLKARAVGREVRQ